jgi:sortase B
VNFDTGEFPPATILYGHALYAGGYFSTLKNYYFDNDLSTYSKYPVIQFDSLYQRSDWKIFAACYLNTTTSYGDVFPYVNTLSFNNKDVFNEYILGIMDRSVLFTDVDLEYGDELLALSTCYTFFGEAGENIKTRIVVFARRVRDGESSYVDVSKAKHNYNELRFEKHANTKGTLWKGRIWDTTYLKSYKKPEEDD